MKNALIFFQVLISILLITIILLQARGTGLSSVFGGESSFYRSKRGVEKLFVYLTIALAALFLITSTILVVI